MSMQALRHQGMAAGRRKAPRVKKETVVTRLRSYRDIIAWQRGKQLAKLVYIATSKTPREEMFGLTSQMRRASVSIASNIAEGYGRQSLPDYLKYLRIARGSLAELSTQYEIASELESLPADTVITKLMPEVERVPQALILSLERKLIQ